MAATPQAMQSPVTGDGPSSTAHVLDFVCLFTHDLRRKQKRWQDGRLKFHDFNKRIMVYDERGNFIGDTHWREDYDFGEDEEVTLERGGVIVQVQECVGSRSQDLSELIDKRVQEKAQRQSAAIARHARSTPTVHFPIVTQATTPHLQVRQTPLHNTLGPPTGHHGRALIPTESPYEQRQRQSAQQNPHQDESPRPAKRRRREPSPSSKSGYARSLFGATLTLSGRPMSSNPVRHLSSSMKVQRQDPDLPPSSDQSIPAADDDDVRVVAPPAEFVRQRALPLSEQTVGVTNTNRNLPDALVLVGKDARSKANVPALLRHRKPADEANTQSAIKPTNPRSKRAIQATEQEASQLPAMKETAAKSEQTGTIPTRPERTKHQPPAERLAPEKSRQPSDKQASVGKDTTRRSRSEYESSETQSGSSQPVIDLTEPENQPRAPAVVEKPQIEYRIKSSKRRGLLMVSEKKSLKKAKRCTESGNPDGSNDVNSGPNRVPSDRGHLEISDDNRSSGNGNPKRTTPKPGTVQHFKPESPENSDSTMVHGSRRNNNSDYASTSNSAGSGLPNQVQARKLSPGRKGVTSKTPDPLSSSRTPGDPVLPCLSQEQKDLDQDDTSSCDTSFEEAAPRIQRQVQVKRSSRNIPMQERNESYQLDSSPVSDIERCVKAATAASNQSLYENGATASRHRTKGSEQSFPRLAPLARRGIRSKEVFGLFPDSDDESSTEVEVAKPQSIQSRTRTDNKHSREPAPSGWTGITMERTSFTGNRYSTIPQSLPEVVQDEDAMVSTLAEAAKSIAGLQQEASHRKEDEPQSPTELATAEPCSPQQNLVVSRQATRVAGTDRSAINASRVPGKGQGMICPGKHAGRHDLQQERALWDCDESVPSHVLHNDVHENPSVQKGVEPRPIPKISNPATRGKKAARPSDAAGQVPESILPADGSNSMVRQVGRPPPPVAEKGAKQPAHSMPGFSRANGGPWSREAHDLFEYRRPG
jgi:hypothetical protein